MRYKFECIPVETLDTKLTQQSPMLETLRQIQGKLNQVIETYNLENDRLHKMVKELQDELDR